MTFFIWAFPAQKAGRAFRCIFLVSKKIETKKDAAAITNAKIWIQKQMQ